MNAYMTPDVANWARKAKVTHKMLLKAAEEVAKGLIDVNHRFGLYKKRVATNTGQGPMQAICSHNDFHNKFFIAIIRHCSDLVLVELPFGSDSVINYPLVDIQSLNSCVSPRKFQRLFKR